MAETQLGARASDAGQSFLSTRGPDWWGGIHAVGTIPPRTALGVDATSWSSARDALIREPGPAGRLDSR